MKKGIIFLLLSLVFSLNTIAQKRTFQEKLQLLNISYNASPQYTILSETSCYLFADDKCPINKKMQLVEGLLLSKDKECMVGIFFTPFYAFGCNCIHKNKNNRYSLHVRIANDFLWVKAYRSPTEQDLIDIESLMKHYPNDTAKAFFNADYMFSYPLNFQGEVCNGKFRYGRAVVIGKERVLNIILYFVTTEQGIKNIDNYILDMKGVFKFENEELR